MKGKTKDAAFELIELLDEYDDAEVVAFDINEYRTGDPTASDSEATGAEIDLKCYLSFDADSDDSDNPFRVK